MPKKAARSAFARLREQAAEQNVFSFANDRPFKRGARLEHNQNENKLLIFWPDVNAQGGFEEINASRLLKFPELAVPFAEALLFAGSAKSWATASLIKVLATTSHYFFAYLEAEKKTNLQASEITTLFVNGYIRWLNRAEYGKSSLSVATRETAMSGLRSLIKGLKKTTWGQGIPGDLEIRSNIWVGQKSVAARKTPTIPHDDFNQIYQACVREILEISSDVLRMRAEMADSLNNPLVLAKTREEREALALEIYGKTYGKVPNIYRDRGILLAAIHHRYPCGIVSLACLEKDESDPSLGKAISRFHGGWGKVSRCFYPTPRALMPFLIMLGIHLYYNLETLLASKLSDYLIRANEIGREEFVVAAKECKNDAEEPNAHEEYVIANPKKARARGNSQPQVRPATDDIDNPASIYKFLVEWTDDARSFADVRFKERLFLFFSSCSKSGDRPRGFRGYDGTCGSDASFDFAYEAFFKENKLNFHSFKELRSTGLDIVDVVFGGDIRAKQAAGNHSEPNVTYKRYTTGSQMERGDEVLGEARLLHERWRRSHGRIDPRRKPAGSDLGAATPGWHCLDPFSSPIGQKDKLCEELGQCPVCPHASIPSDSAYACAQAWNLLSAIDEASSELPPQAWLKRWLPVKKEILEYWLPRFTNDAYTKAKQYRLNPLPPLE